ncbi:MAG TPA: hypothetical protein VGA92_00410 [Candidatus Nitrosotenuis sp.]
MVNKDYKSQVIVVRKKIDEGKTRQMVEEKKTSLFRSLLKKPAKDEVHIHSIGLNYEAILMISGRYVADFYRKATHPIKVDYNVTQVVLGDGVFPIQIKSRWKTALGGKKGKNKVDLELEEHVSIDDECTLYFDHHGRQTKLPLKLDPKNMENYPTKILQNTKFIVKKPELTHKDAISKLEEELKKPIGTNARNLNEKITITEISEIYIPIYEARLVGPKKKVEILRIDAAKNKIL